jgi:NodT family efflux transporter outer membrane factor (OMF) lipoprotein
MMIPSHLIDTRSEATPAGARALPVDAAPAPAPRPGGPLIAWSVLLLCAVLGGCAADRAIAPQETMPSPQALAAKLQLAPPAAGAAASQIATDWWTAFNDPELTHWIELGLADSPDLRVAQARLVQAQAEYAVARSALGPSVNGSATSVPQRISENGIFPPPLGGFVGTINDLDLSASIELDIFGRLRARSDAARLDAEASAVERDEARIRLAAAIGHAYFELARAQQARRIAQELEASRIEFLDLVRERVKAGLDTQVERRLAEVTVPEIRVDIERDSEQIALARHSLALLAGQPPGAADQVEAHLPAQSAFAPPERLPLDLLARRADIAAAQRRVQSALRGVDAARADFYPNVNLSGLVGLDAIGLRRLFEGSSRTWQVEPAVHLPIFESGSLRANLRSASARTDEAIDGYNATVLRAASEVADALSSLDSVQRQRAQQGEATSNAQAASDLATIRYRAGLGNFLAVLTAQTGVLTQRRAQVDLDARAAALDVSLALALGGGYRDAEAPPVATASATR